MEPVTTQQLYLYSKTKTNLILANIGLFLSPKHSTNLELPIYQFKKELFSFFHPNYLRNQLFKLKKLTFISNHIFSDKYKFNLSTTTKFS